MRKTIPREFSLKALEQALGESAQKLQDGLVAKGLPRYVLEGKAIVRIAPDGSRRTLRRESGKIG